MDYDPLKDFAEIGMITHHFEQCEFSLSELFLLLCESENDAPFQIFGQIVSSNLRLTMTGIALEECMPRPSALKAKITAVLAEFKACQTLRNRSIHQSIFPVIRDGKLANVGMPLWHQTIRYKGGALKPGLEISAEQLSETNHQITLLVFALRGVVDELSEFLGARKKRRLRKLTLAPRRRKAAR
ncbi:hypothetical protein U1839_26495 [Sphingomonas sp. RT2P30]